MGNTKTIDTATLPGDLADQVCALRAAGVPEAEIKRRLAYALHTRRAR